MNAEEVLERLTSEGWGYCIQCYMSAEAIEDPEVKEAYANAESAVEKLESVLREKLGDDYDAIVDGI